MKILENSEDKRSCYRNFDGVHLGHQQIIATAVKAKEDSKPPKLVALTFDPHPTAILAPKGATTINNS